MNNAGNMVIAVLDDLMFMVKIQEALKRAGVSGTFVKTQQEALMKARDGAVLMILDLNCVKAEPLETIAKLKADDATRSIPLLGYVSHVQVDVRQAAVERGCDRVLARSVFVQNLTGILAQLNFS